jgi:uncharacterized protein YecE (DUF72 family)
MSIRIGTSGWVYNHWRELFYPPSLKQAEWFSYYARQFDTVEINNSFYRLPSAETFTAWRQGAPPGFLFAVKASRYLTHMKKLLDPQEPLKLFFERADHLDDSLGPILYQLPPRWRVNLPRFEAFLAALPRGYLHAVEFREASWLIEEVFRLLERYDVAHCIHDMHPLEVPPRVASRAVYLRFHGVTRYGGSYPAETLAFWGRRIHAWQSEGRDIYAYFNNDIGGYALQNAATLKRMLGL